MNALAHPSKLQATDARPVIVGVGVTGQSIARHLHKQGASFWWTDTRNDPPGIDALRAAFSDIWDDVWAGPLPALNDNALREMRPSRVWVSPGVAVQEGSLASWRAAGVPFGGDLDLFAEVDRRPRIGITGSNGKSTVTVLVGDLLKALGVEPCLGGNLGTPALDLCDCAGDVVVLELSSFQLDANAPLALDAAALLNLSEDHLDHHVDMSAYRAAKLRIAARAARVVIHRDDPFLSGPEVDGALVPVAEVIAYGDANAAATSVAPPAFGLHRYQGATWLMAAGRPFVPAAELSLVGRHNLLNVVAALALVWPWVERADGGYDAVHERLRAAVTQFCGLPHRCQTVAEVAGVRYVDDSKATNVGATLAALSGIEAPVILIAGGQGKGQNFEPLADAAAGRVRGALLLGADAAAIAEVLNDVLPVRRVASMEEAVLAAADWAAPGDVVLLSPACASFDMFRDYADRGRQFATCARALA